MKNILKLCSIALLFAILPSCSTTMLMSSYLQHGYTPQQFKKVLVLGIGKSTSGRATVEGAMINALNKKGINAVTAIDVFPNYNPDVKLEKSAMAEKLKEKNIDGLLILSVLDVKTEQVYVQGATYQKPVGEVYHQSGYANQYYQSYGNSYGYYQTVYETVQEPGYYEDRTNYYLESNFYKVSDESLVWSGQCKAFDPADIGSASKDWSAEVVNGMQKDKVFAK